ncbi:toll/interleukin-1 receptor domain-containing protein [Enterococcus sp. ZJ1622]|uniref:toll/interleukin-1 receptor domain-containing protein n=1 Tax=Enterococcus sp. ZJ1622 TaxID=2709401 RepID=UPI0013E9A24D|nr:toll/interleukin-1 receptor domain-containing protein [Enterococcus sp. ZJ1622]
MLKKKEGIEIEGIFRIYNPLFLESLLKKSSDDYRKHRFHISISELGIIQDNREFYFVKKAIENFFEYRFSKTILVQLNRRENLLEIGEIHMKKRITYRFPYEKYDSYYEVIKEINDLVDVDGVCGVFANNIYYCLEAGIIVETNSNFEQIKQVAERAGMEVDYSFGIEELTVGMSHRQYNNVILRAGHDIEGIKLSLAPLFSFPSKKNIEENNYSVKTITKKKIFVSYSHNDKNVVRKIISDLRDYGLDFWIDEEQIDVGDRLMERIDEGIRQADIPIVFLSESTKNAMFAKHELLSFFTKVIYQQSSKKSWFIVKLDQVNPNDIVFGLGDFKYIDYSESCIEEIAQAIERKIKKTNNYRF